jgi:hypothetical protein
VATEKQIAANRANAQKSTGPSSPAGKSRASRNSYRHGLLSKNLILGWEEEKEFRRLVNALNAEHRPQGATETLLVEQMAVSLWKISRLTGMESAVMERQFTDYLTAGFNPGKTTEDKFNFALSHTLPKNLQVLLNYEALLNKGYYRALNTLQALQARRETIIEGEAAPVEKADQAV